MSKRSCLDRKFGLWGPNFRRLRSPLSLHAYPIIASRPCPCFCGVAICPSWPRCFFLRSRCFLLGLLVEKLGLGDLVDSSPCSHGLIPPSGCRISTVASLLSFAAFENRLMPTVRVVPLSVWRRFRMFSDAVSCESVHARTAPLPLMLPLSSEALRFFCCQSWLQVLQQFH